MGRSDLEKGLESALESGLEAATGEEARAGDSADPRGSSQ
jgi:hypothetical protein